MSTTPQRLAFPCPLGNDDLKKKKPVTGNMHHWMYISRPIQSILLFLIKKEQWLMHLAGTHCREHGFIPLFHWHLLSTYNVPVCWLMALRGLLWLEGWERQSSCWPHQASVWTRKRQPLLKDLALQAWWHQKEVPPPSGRGSLSPGDMVFWAGLSSHLFPWPALLCSEPPVQEFKAVLSRNHNRIPLLLGQTSNPPWSTCLSSQSWPYTPI